MCIRDSVICRDLFAKDGFTLGFAMHGFVQTSLTTHPRPEARVAVHVLGEMSEKVVEVDGFGTEVILGLAINH